MSCAVAISRGVELVPAGHRRELDDRPHRVVGLGRDPHPFARPFANFSGRLALAVLKVTLFIKLLHNHREATRGPMRPASVNDEWGEMSREHFDERCRP